MPRRFYHRLKFHMRTPYLLSPTPVIPFCAHTLSLPVSLCPSPNILSSCCCLLPSLPLPNRLSSEFIYLITEDISCSSSFFRKITKKEEREENLNVVLCNLHDRHFPRDRAKQVLPFIFPTDQNVLRSLLRSIATAHQRMNKGRRQKRDLCGQIIWCSLSD